MITSARENRKKMRKRLTDSSGTYKPAKEWAAMKGISVSGLYKIFQRNPLITIEQAMAMEVNMPSRQNISTYHGEMLTDKQLLVKCDCSTETLRKIRLGGGNIEAELDAFVKKKERLNARKERKRRSDIRAEERVEQIKTFSVKEFGNADSDFIIWHNIEFPTHCFCKLCGTKEIIPKGADHDLDKFFRQHVYRNVLGRKFVPASEIAEYIGMPEKDVLSSRKCDIYARIKDMRSAMLTVNGCVKTTREWSEEFGVPTRNIRMRLRRGWTAERAVKEPVHKYKRIRLEYDGKSLTINEWAAITGIPALNIRMRLGDGYSVERALTTPYHAKGCHRNSLKYEYLGKSLSYYGWAKELDMNYHTLISRIKRGWTLERALTERTS